MPARSGVALIWRVRQTYILRGCEKSFCTWPVSSRIHRQEVKNFLSRFWASFFTFQTTWKRQGGRVLILLFGLCKHDQKAAEKEYGWEESEDDDYRNVPKVGKWAISESNGQGLVGAKNLDISSTIMPHMVCRQLQVLDRRQYFENLEVEETKRERSALFAW